MTHEFEVLDALERLGTATTGEIAELCGVDRSTILRMLKTLQKFRMVTMLGQVITTGTPTKRWRLTV